MLLQRSRSDLFMCVPLTANFVLLANPSLLLYSTPLIKMQMYDLVQRDRGGMLLGHDCFREISLLFRFWLEHFNNNNNNNSNVNGFFVVVNLAG